MDLPTTSDRTSDCPGVSRLLGQVGDKWTVQVLVALRDQARRFNDLKRRVDGISQQMLTRTLSIAARNRNVSDAQSRVLSDAHQLRLEVGFGARFVRLGARSVRRTRDRPGRRRIRETDQVGRAMTRCRRVLRSSECLNVSISLAVLDRTPFSCGSYLTSSLGRSAWIAIGAFRPCSNRHPQLRSNQHLRRWRCLGITDHDLGLHRVSHK